MSSRTQEWPIRSPVLSMDFFLWDYVKEKVFAISITADMKLRIEHAFQNITDNTLQKVENFRLRVINVSIKMEVRCLSTCLNVRGKGTHINQISQ